MTMTKYAHCYRVQSVALCPPAVRMVVVQAWAYRDHEREGKSWEVRHIFMPVAAIAAVLRHNYSAPRAQQPRDLAPNHTGMTRLGWSYEGANLRYDCLIQDEEAGGLMGVEELNDAANVVAYPYPCPWPADEDERRLQDAVAHAKGRALDKAKAHDRARTAAPTRPDPGD
jgi:hypothetical protein